MDMLSKQDEYYIDAIEQIMTGQISLLLKVLLLSMIGSALIKYAVPYALSSPAIAPSPTIAVVSILLPSLILAIFLWWRSQNSESVK